MNITTFLNQKGFYTFEGYSQEVQPQVADLIELTKTPNINMMEIGFNAGHSAEIFLKNNPTCTLTSFDLGMHPYVSCAKEYIDTTYPNRHTLILGDSRITVPEYQTTTFDVIFIDGGHDYDIAKTDLENCFKFAHKDTIVIMDDTCFINGWETFYTVGPTKTWIEHVYHKKIMEINTKNYWPGRGMAWGKYIIKE